MLKYKCSICPLTSWVDLTEHENTPHLECPICGERRVGLAQHISKAHREDAAERGRRISEGMRRRGLAR
jgi:DNA-directed RNA polymerase subunit RPC12/RpoP